MNILLHELINGYQNSLQKEIATCLTEYASTFFNLTVKFKTTYNENDWFMKERFLRHRNLNYTSQEYDMISIKGHINSIILKYKN